MFSRSSPVTEAAILDALRVVQDPDLHKDIVSLGFVKRVAIDGGAVGVTIELTTPACPVKELLRDQAAAAIRGVAGVTSVEVDMTAMVRSAVVPGRRARADPRHPQHHRRRRRQGRRRQDHRRGQPGHRPGEAGQPRRHHRRRHLRPQRADHAGRPDPAHARRREDRAGREVRHLRRVDGLPHQRRRAGDLARADAARRRHAVLPRRALARAGLPDRRHAAGHRRRGAQPEPVGAGVGRGRRDHAAAGVAGRYTACRENVREAQCARRSGSSRT